MTGFMHDSKTQRNISAENRKWNFLSLNKDLSGRCHICSLRLGAALPARNTQPEQRKPVKCVYRLLPLWLIVNPLFPSGVPVEETRPLRCARDEKPQVISRQ